MGYNGRGFFPLWDTTEKVFLHCRIQWKRFFPLWDTTEKNLKKANNFFPLYLTTLEFFFCCFLHQNRILCGVLYPTIQHRRIVGSNTEQSSALYPTTPQVFFRIVSHNAAGFLPLYPTMEDILLRCGIQQKRFFPFLDTTEEVFLHCGIQRKMFSVVGYNGRGFFHCGIQWRKMIQRKMIFLNFKFLSLPSNRNLGKINYLNNKTNPWEKLKIENYMVNHEKLFFFLLWDTPQQKFFKIFELK